MATFTNRASFTYNETTVLSNETTGEIPEQISLAKTALLPEYSDAPVVYIVTAVNEGQTPYDGLSFSDDLGAYAFSENTLYPLSYVQGSVRLFLNGALVTPPAVQTENGVVFSGISLPAGANVVLVYAANVTEYAPLGAGEGVTNTVILQGGGLTQPLEASATVTAKEEPMISIVKSLSPLVVTEDREITYTFVVENSGNMPLDASANATVNDVFTPALSNIAVSLNGTPLEEGSGYSYDESTGVFSTVPGLITVPAATETQDPARGAYSVTPGKAVLTVTGTI